MPKLKTQINQAGFLISVDPLSLPPLGEFRRGRINKSPPQFGQILLELAAQSGQKVHSKEQT